MENLKRCPQGHTWPEDSDTLTCPKCGLEPETGPGTDIRTDLYSPVEDGSTVVSPSDRRRFELPGYEILGRLGRGGMGTVYQARHAESQRLVAIKVLHEDHSEDEQHRARFRAESRALMRLEHPGIVRCLDAGEHQGRLYFVLELMTGGSLQACLAERSYSPREAAQLVEALAHAVQYAHLAGVIHRDLKPGNVLLDGQGQPRVSDFGLAKQLDGSTLHTMSGAIMGTPAFMAPEQADGHVRQIGPTTDVYALGAILYACLTGQPPFTGESKIRLLDRVRREEPTPPSKLRPEVPRDLETICLKAIHKSPHKRYPSAQALAEDLRNWLENRPIQARPAGMAERADKWRQRNPVLAALLLVALVTGLVGGLSWLWYWDAYLRLKMEQHAFVVYRRGVAQGGKPISEAQARQRSRSYRVYKRAGLVERVEVVRPDGKLAGPTEEVALLQAETRYGPDGPSGECAFEYRRDPQGRLVEEVARDRDGRILWVLHHASEGMAYYRDAKGFPTARTTTGAAYLSFQWDDSGLAREVRFLGRTGKPRPRQDGVFGYRDEFGPLGLVVRRTHLDAEGRPMLDKDRSAGEEVRYDEWGQTVGVRQLDVEGRPCNSAKWFCSVEFDYDERGNRVAGRFFDVAGKPCLHRDGNHSWRAKYDERGFAVRFDYYGLNGEPCPKSRSGASGHEDDYDEAGNLIERRWYLDGKPCLHPDGNHIVRMKYQNSGQPSEVSYYGLDGEPCLRKDGFWRVVSVLDAEGRPVETRYYGVDGNPCLHRDGNHIVRSRRDERGNVVEYSYFGLKGEPTLAKEGTASYRLAYDEEGLESERAYFGLNGKPCLNKERFHKVVIRRDERGNQIDRAFFGTDGSPVVNVYGIARIRFVHDARGHEVEKRFFGPEGKPCLDKRGAHAMRSDYDALGNERQVEHFGLEDKPTTVEGVFRIVHRHDDLGRLVESRYFGPDGKPCLHEDGNHGFRQKYDARGLVVECVWFGQDGKPAPKKDGIIRVMYRHTPFGQSAEDLFTDGDGKPMRIRDGYHRVRRLYDERGFEKERTYFDTEGKPAMYQGKFARHVLRHDERGQRIAESFFGTDNRPVLVNGVHTARSQFDERGNRFRGACFGPDNRPTVHTDGNHSWQSTFDERDRPIRTEYFDPDGKPCLRRKLFHRVAWRYDERDNQTEEAFFMPDGTPALVNGVARVVSRYDSQDRMVSQTLYGRDGQKLGEVRFDSEGPTEMVVFDRNGQPVPMQVQVGRVLRDSVGQKLGIRPGDVIRTYAGEPVRSRYLFIRAHKKAVAGSPPQPLVVRRNGKDVRLMLPPGPIGVELLDVPAR